MDYCDYIEMDAVINRHLEDDAPEPGTVPHRISGPKPQECRYCFAQDLWWKQTQAKVWRLHDEDGMIHVCAQYGQNPKKPISRKLKIKDEDIPY